MKRNSFFGENMEFFNGMEWKKISEYTKGEKILTYNIKEKKAIMSTPTKFIKKKSMGLNLFKYGKNKDLLNMELSDEAVFVGDAREFDTIRRFTLKDSYEGNFSMFSHVLLYNTFNYNGKSCMLSCDRIKVMIYSLILGDIKNNTCTLKVEKKKDYIKLLRDANIKYKSKKEKSYTILEYNLPRNKELFLSNPLNFNSEEIFSIVDSINSLLPIVGKIESNDTSILDFLQMIFALHGIKVKIKNNRLYIYDTSYSRLNEKIISIEYKKSNYQYSFTVQTGFIILRNSGSIFVFGDYKNS